MSGITSEASGERRPPGLSYACDPLSADFRSNLKRTYRASANVEFMRVYVSSKNRVWTGVFLIFALAIGSASAVSSANAAATIIGALVALECFYFSCRLIAMSSLNDSPESIEFRTKYFRRRQVPMEDIDSVVEASRVFIYQRTFPRLILRSGDCIDLINFEEADSRRQTEGGSVRSVVTLVSEALLSGK